MANVFVPKGSYEAEHPPALAIYCSDGRFTNAVEELTEGHLKNPRLDTLTLPGGPGCLSTTSGGYSEVEVVRKAAQFLITGHHITHCILVAHAGCGWYREKLGAHLPEMIEKRQKDDLRESGRWLHQKFPALEIRLYFARPQDAKIHFEPIDA